MWLTNSFGSEKDSGLRSVLHSKWLCLFLLLLFQNVSGVTTKFYNVAALQTGISNASAGDILVLANGTYLNNSIDIQTSNITVKAETPGGVFLNGANSISIEGSYVTFSGFQFTSGTINTIMFWVYGSHNVLTQLNFNGYSAQKYISLIAPGQYNEISYCNFENKPATATSGNLIHIDPSSTVPGYHRIHHNSFQNMPGAGGDNGNECIRISNGATSTYVSRTIVEFNYFTNTGPGDSEAISNKSRENVIRYNTMENNPDAMFCFRNGDNCVAYGNFFIKSGGIRVKEANNIYCYNNYFEKAGTTGTMDAVTFVYYTANTTNVLNNINFLHNTFVECGNIDLGGVGATNNTWANNIFKKSSGAIFINPNSGTTFAGNIYNGTLGINIASGMTNADPKLILNSDGYYGISATSPAIGAASSAYPGILDIAVVDDDPNILLDISRQSRPSVLTLKDVGCDQYSTEKITNRPLKLADVGPVYLSQTAAITALNRDASDLKISYDNANSRILVSYALSDDSEVSACLVDMSGREVQSLITHEHQTVAFYQRSFAISELSQGVYILRLLTNKNMRTLKFIVPKR